MEDAITCVVCSEVYQAGPREPLVLPCGHTFCRTCLLNLQTSGDFLCPSCRRDLNHLQVDSLPLCFSLLGLSSMYTGIKHELCRDHGGELTYWCRGCALPLCGLCLYSGHPRGHDVQLAKVCLQEKKRALQGQIQAYHQNLNENKKDIMKKVSSCFVKIKRLCHRGNRLHEVGREVEDLSREVQNVDTIENILVAEVKVRSLQDKQLYLLSSGCSETEIDDITDDEWWPPEDMAAQKTLEAAAMAQQQTQSNSNVSGDKRQTRLDCQDGKLVLHAFSKSIDTRLSLQVPSEVFLELNVGGRCLGRVYIRLMSHLRRAQQFLLLCLGSLGPSYIGATFFITAHNQERETLDVRRYVLPDGSTSNKILMSDLEWGGRFAGPAKERVVMGSFYGNDTHGFGICTRGQPGGVFQCPFGEVMSGMEVVKAAVRHDPISEVVITDCGMVVPDLAS